MKSSGFIRLAAGIALCLLPLLAIAQAGESRLVFRESGRVVADLGLEQILQTVTVGEIRFFNPLMNKVKRYRAVQLNDVLTAVYGSSWAAPDYSDVVFMALDGYEAIGGIAMLREDGAYLAFEDLDQDTGWEPVGRRRADPGPFFLVWTGEHQTTSNGYPWPWQVAELGLLRFEDRYPAVVPRFVDTESPEHRGYEIFRTRCIRCHAMDRQGGKVGPDLNAPQSIVDYRSEEMIKAFIRQASQFRYSHMPDHTDLSDRDLDDLYGYFVHQAKH